MLQPLHSTLTFELKRRVVLPGMSPATPLEPGEVEDKLSTGRVQTEGRLGHSPVPVYNRQALSDLCFFAGLQAAKAPAHPALAAALQAIEDKGWAFQGQKNGKFAYLDTFGAYTALTEPRFGIERLIAMKGRVIVEIPSEESAVGWSDSFQGEHGRESAAAGPAALQAAKSSANPGLHLVQQGKLEEAHALLDPEHPLTPLIERLSPSRRMLELAFIQKDEPDLARAGANLLKISQGLEQRILALKIVDACQDKPSVEFTRELVAEPFTELDMQLLRVGLEHADDPKITARLLKDCFALGTTLERHTRAQRAHRALQERMPDLSLDLRSLELDGPGELVRALEAKESAERLCDPTPAAGVHEGNEAVTLSHVRLRKRK